MTSDKNFKRNNELRQSLRGNNAPRDEPIEKLLKSRVTLPSVAIQRLVDEVSADEPATGYNRTYHRHNRS